MRWNKPIIKNQHILVHLPMHIHTNIRKYKERKIRKNTQAEKKGEEKQLYCVYLTINRVRFVTVGRFLLRHCTVV